MNSKIDETEKLRITVTIALIAIIITLFFSGYSLLKENLQEEKTLKDDTSVFFSPIVLSILSMCFLFYEALLLFFYLILTAYELKYRNKKPWHASLDFLYLFSQNNRREKLYDYAVGISFYPILIPFYLIIMTIIRIEPIITILSLMVTILIIIITKLLIKRNSS